MLYNDLELMAFSLNIILLIYGLALNLYRPYENNQLNKFEILSIVFVYISLVIGFLCQHFRSFTFNVIGSIIIFIINIIFLTVFY